MNQLIVFLHSRSPTAVKIRTIRPGMAAIMSLASSAGLFRMPPRTHLTVI